MEKIFELVGIEVPEIWLPSGCSNHEKVKTILEVEEGKVIATVRPDKLKLFGKDQKGVIRSISWRLVSAEPEAEASLLLQERFGVALPPPQQKIMVFN
jgi:hypothetical protein